MAVYRKRMPNGDWSPTLHYEFVVNGKRYRGSTGCSTKTSARAFERNQIEGLRQAKSVDELAEARRQAITGGQSVSLVDAFDLAAKKPGRRKAAAGWASKKRSQWADFVAFMKERYPDVTRVSDVARTHAEAYIGHLRDNGRFDKTRVFRQKGRRRQITATYGSDHLSPRAVNIYHVTLAEVFDRLASDVGLTANPFRGVPKLAVQTEARETFTPAELRTIGAKADPFVYALFAIGMTTALREGDIATLRWAEIDLDSGWITRRTSKTGKVVRVPILPPLRNYLMGLKAKSDGSEYVLPEHAAMYKANPTGITYRVKAFLEGLEIETTRKVPGRDRAVSVKDVHSLRHTFCYLAAVYGVPFNVVKAVAGHVDAKVTQTYMDHVTDDLKREKLASIPNLLGLPEGAGADLGSMRQRVHTLADTASADILARMLAAAG